MSNIMTLQDIEYRQVKTVRLSDHEKKVKDYQEGMLKMLNMIKKLSLDKAKNKIEIEVLEKRVETLTKQLKSLNQTPVTLTTSKQESNLFATMNKILLQESGMTKAEAEKYRADYIDKVSRKYG